MRLRPMLIAAALVHCAAAGAQPPEPATESPEGERAVRRPPIFVSPAGRVYRASPSEPPPLAAWFGAVDGDDDRAIGWTEFRADFLATFAELDRDGDGEIEPEEVTHYETAVLPEMSGRASGLGVGRGAMAGRMRRGEGRMGGMRPGGERRLRGGGGRAGASALMARFAGAARFGLLPIPHPIMAADEDFNRGVTRAEYERAAASRFAMLNGGGDGRLTLEELTELRPQRPGRGGDRERQAADAD